jgi:hypothetical protein
MGEADEAGVGVAGHELREHSAEAERLVVGVGDHREHAGDRPERITARGRGHRG